ncbi:hypothetical protein LINPERHAP2_LOCUS37610 [Linum perenne]
MVASSVFIVNTLYLVASSRSCHPGTLVLTRSNVSWEQSLMSWNCPLIVKYTPSSMFLYSNLPMVLHSLPPLLHYLYRPMENCCLLLITSFNIVGLALMNYNF